MSIADRAEAAARSHDTKSSTGRSGNAVARRSRARLLKRAAPPVVLALVVMWTVPAYASNYWLFVLTSGVIAIPVMQSLGVITGRVGVMSLCQMSFAMIGAWVCGWCNVHGVPGGFWVWMAIGGLAAVPAGLLIGFPALRLRGVNLAIVTFVFATMIDVIFASKQFPGADNFKFVPKPAGFTTDGGYFRFSVIVVAAIFLLIAYVDRTRLGASWLELRYSERGAAAHGTNVALSKLAAFGVSAFIAGIAGTLIVGQVGSTTPAPFAAQTSLVYFAIAVVLGVRFLDGAVIAGLAGSLFPVLLDKVHVDTNYVSIVFGVAAVLILGKGKGQYLGQTEIARARKQAKAARAILESGRSSLSLAHTATTVRPPRTASPAGTAPALELRDITVRFGAVTAVDNVSLVLPKGSVTALLGPNGAGKSTLISMATGFAPGSGRILLDGVQLGQLPPHRRARCGLRRSFQQLRVPPTLTVGQFLTTAAGRRLTASEIDEFLEWFGCPPAHVPIGTMDVGARR
ncbi:MAG: ABC transporter permease subunit, partial [Acidothermaceae bacterium]